MQPGQAALVSEGVPEGYSHGLLASSQQTGFCSHSLVNAVVCATTGCRAVVPVVSSSSITT